MYIYIVLMTPMSAVVSSPSRSGYYNTNTRGKLVGVDSCLIWTENGLFAVDRWNPASLSIKGEAGPRMGAPNGKN